jgi:hypothetical protein
MDGRQIRESLLENPHDCLVLDDALLDSALRESGAGFLAGDIFRNTPHLFSRASVFIDHASAEAMRGVVRAVERVVALPAYTELALADAAECARVAPISRGAFLGYDFHLSSDGPQLIEINTNAGGGLLNTLLRRSQRACCSEVLPALAPEPPDAAKAFVSILREEYALVRGSGAELSSIAIVDDAPEDQYLFPEFQLFQRLFQASGLRSRICDAAALSLREGKLWAEDMAVDLVYNRSTDIALTDPRHLALAIAYRDGLAVVTPHPRAHALYADKRRLCTLSDASALAALGVSSDDANRLLKHIPRTRLVDKAARDALWAERKQLFFKPCAGYGSKATYRGDKLTRRVFEEQVLVAPYVAQRLVPPSSRIVRAGQDAAVTLKVDVRNFAYAGGVQLVCARLYDGQTTNFRTAGGGFAPVFEIRP